MPAAAVRLIRFLTLSAITLLPGLVPASESIRLPPAASISSSSIACNQQPSVARAWNEELLAAIRLDAPRPTVHARNLFHVSAAMYDAWAAYQSVALPVFHADVAASADESARVASISHAAYRLLVHRFSGSPGAPTTLPRLEACMQALGLDPLDSSTVGNSPAALGNRVAQTLIDFGASDGANEAGDYTDDGSYFPANVPMLVQFSGTGGMADPNAWQPLIPPGAFGVQSFLTPFWSRVAPFAITRPSPNEPYLDPGPPPLLGGDGDAELKQAMLGLIRASSRLDPELPEMIDRSPAAWGNNPLGSDDGSGHARNPSTGLPYPPNLMRLGDFGRVSAEFWADGPASSTPPGHWNEIANTTFDHPGFDFRMFGRGPALDRLEWDVKLYLALNGALHDAAIATWETKRQYDSSRPISLIREMGSFGQSSDDSLPAYHPLGLPLEPGLVEIITADSVQPGERHEHLAAHVGEIAVLSWLTHPADPATEYGGIGWLRAVDWWPYQARDFVSPPFAGYTSGHSGFSRAAAEVLTRLSGSRYFPGGLATFEIGPNGPDYQLVFEYGPSEVVELQWATYYDAADEAGESRIWGGIHPTFDDYPGRIIGSAVGTTASQRAELLFGTAPSRAVDGPGRLAELALMLLLLLSGGLALSCAGRRLA
jgi:hypothetical protein